jgi:outer membrane biosynthesis protein TonB
MAEAPKAEPKAEPKPATPKAETPKAETPKSTAKAEKPQATKPDPDHSAARRSAIDALRSTGSDAAAPATSPGTVTVEGDAEAVSLAARGSRFAPGDPLTPGRYEIWARFPGDASSARAGVVDVPAGGTAAVRCEAALRICAPR